MSRQSGSPVEEQVSTQEQGSAAVPQAQGIVENRTARQIVIAGQGGSVGLRLRPFETIEVRREELELLDYKSWMALHLIRVREPSSKESLRGGTRLAALGLRLSALVQMVFSSLTFLLVMLIGFGLPLIPVLLWVYGEGEGAAGFSSLSPKLLFWQFLRWLFVGMAASMPAMMYFLFYRAEVRTLRETFLRDIVQMSPHLGTIDAAEDLYGARVDEVYGNIDSPRELLGTHLPILTSTFLIALGWVLVVPLAEKPETNAILAIQPTTVGFGFLGAYFYVLNMVFRRYVRSDLGPKAYNHISLRMLTTLVLVLVLGLLPGEDSATLKVLAFFVGIVPETALVTLQDYLKNSRLLKSQLPSLRESCPLTDLEGISLYDRARLLEEGIENVENLAHHNLVDLLLWTRIPTERLVDLVDQAILYLHVAPHPPNGGDENSQPGWNDLTKLRRYGIRTATDLIRAYEAARKMGRENAEVLLSLLDDTQDPRGPRRLGVIMSTLLDDSWLNWLRHWMHRTEFSQKVCHFEEFSKREAEHSRNQRSPAVALRAAS